MQINSAVLVWSSKTLFTAIVIVSAEHELSYTVHRTRYIAQQRKTGSASVERSGTSVEVERKHWDSIATTNCHILWPRAATSVCFVYTV